MKHFGKWGLVIRRDIMASSLINSSLLRSGRWRRLHFFSKRQHSAKIFIIIEKYQLSLQTYDDAASGLSVILNIDGGELRWREIGINIVLPLEMLKFSRRLAIRHEWVEFGALSYVNVLLGGKQCILSAVILA